MLLKIVIKFTKISICITKIFMQTNSFPTKAIQTCQPVIKKLSRLDLLWKITNQDSNLTFNNNSILFLVISTLICLTLATLLAKNCLFKIFGRRRTRCVLLLERQLPIYEKLDFF